MTGRRSIAYEAEFDLARVAAVELERILGVEHVQVVLDREGASLVGAAFALAEGGGHFAAIGGNPCHAFRHLWHPSVVGSPFERAGRRRQVLPGCSVVKLALTAEEGLKLICGLSVDLENGADCTRFGYAFDDVSMCVGCCFCRRSADEVDIDLVRPFGDADERPQRAVAHG